MAIHEKRHRFKQDEIIFKEGDDATCAYLIETGRVLVYLNEEATEVPLRILGEGEVFGEMALIDNNKRSATCKALTDVETIIVTREQLLDRIHESDPIVQLLMRVLLERLRSQNERIRSRASEVPFNLDPLAFEKEEAVKRIGLESRIAIALDNDEFIPFYQPIYDLATGEIRGCEALIRWISSDNNVIPPSVFMDVIEESTLILRAGRVMIEKCTADLPKMQTRFGHVEDFFVSVNVSGRQFLDPRLVSHLDECRIKANVPARQIKLELTERVMTEGPQALATLQECRKQGYMLAIDDFGTGFSSLQYLAQMPLTDLKIDRSFISKMCEDKKSLSIIRSLIHLADLLGLKLIAEGIENAEQLVMLNGLKVQMGQGFLFSKAVPLNEFMKLPLKFNT